MSSDKNDLNILKELEDTIKSLDDQLTKQMSLVDRTLDVLSNDDIDEASLSDIEKELNTMLDKTDLDDLIGEE